MRNNFLLLQGGLGNQLFELFFSTAYILSFNQVKKVKVVSSLLGKYNTPRSLEVVPLMTNKLVDYRILESCFIDKIRLAKIIAKITGHETPLRVPFFGNVFDGYFQDHFSYKILNKEVLALVITIWREALLEEKFICQSSKSSLSHIRLGDMFTSRESAYNYLHERVRSLPNGAQLITDDEPLVNEFLNEYKSNRDFSLLSTVGFSAWEVLHLMTGFKSIYTNGSTLAFWGCILNGGKLESSNRHHNVLCKYLNRTAASHSNK